MNVAADIWAGPVADWLVTALPREPFDLRGWAPKDKVVRRYRAEVLVRLGRQHAVYDELEDVPVHARPGNLPLWDDICMVVLAIADRDRVISFRPADGRPLESFVEFDGAGFIILPPNATETLSPNIEASHGCAPARAQADLLVLLQVLGLVSEGAWTEQAETVIWRIQPKDWSMEPTNDPRFDEGLARCLNTMPENVVETLHDLTEITSETVSAFIELYAQRSEASLAEHPIFGRLSPEIQRSIAYGGLLSKAKKELDDLFFNTWRLPDGWIQGEAAERAMYIFDDPLAIAMRSACLEAMNLSFPEEMPQ